MNEAMDPMNILRCRGWRANADELTLSRPASGEILHYTGSMGIGGWWHTRMPVAANGWATAVCVGDTLADAVMALYPEDMLDAGLGALLLRGLAVETRGVDWSKVPEVMTPDELPLYHQNIDDKW